MLRRHHTLQDTIAHLYLLPLPHVQVLSLAARAAVALLGAQPLRQDRKKLLPPLILLLLLRLLRPLQRLG